ncbi:MAG TPA: cyclic nucleotide-binding domain-containing protein [Chloroflexota bacterium]|jgi:CRP-like cAMP-binding protein
MTAVSSSVFFTGDDPSGGFLAGLDDDEIATILDYTQSRRFGSGESAVRAGEKNRSLYIVTSGRFEVLVPSPTGPLRATVFEPGDMFGELAFFDNQPRSADVRAIDDSEALIMTPAGFDRLRLANSRLAVRFVMDLGRILSVRFREYNTRLAALAEL